MLLQAALHNYTDISGLLWRHTHRAGPRHYHEVELSLIMERWYRVMNSHPEARDHPQRPLPSPTNPCQISQGTDRIVQLKKLLHGRHRRRMRLAMSDKVKEMEAFLGAKKLKKLIQKISSRNIQSHLILTVLKM